MPTLVVFAAELVVGTLMLVLWIRFCPLPAIRRELRMRLDAGGVLGSDSGWRRRLALLVVGDSSPRPDGSRDRAE
ncbi:MAG: hypothetical protein JWN95_71 [Frankiales bacterium]|nr:hypothetical protein [Frankiales bacterium]